MTENTITTEKMIQTEKTLLRCNIALPILAIVMIASSLLLECLHGEAWGNIRFTTLVWVHVAVSTGFLLLAAYHVYLHWGSIRQWSKGYKACRSKQTRVLACLFLVVLATGILSVFCFANGIHTTVGGIHGKIGLIAALVSILHCLKRFRWFKHRMSGQAFAPQIDEQKCVRCCQCVKRCPAQVFGKDGKRVVVSHPAYCRQCRKCVERCPKGAIH
ncbi:MAG: 4Fe-4S dicluster domain-containing protein [Bacteroides sp.]|nr:4Fe-4S dicluster domain-containing protein [Bacteroides sp.]